MDSAYAKNFEHALFGREQLKSFLEFLQMMYCNDEAKQQCVGEWPLQSLSNNDGNIVSGTPGH